jgi:hypothetical protein
MHDISCHAIQSLDAWLSRVSWFVEIHVHDESGPAYPSTSADTAIA